MTTINTQGFGIQLAPAGFSLEANKIFENYEAALTFVKTKPAAYVGSVITVKAPSTIDEVTYPAGVYYVTAIGENGALEQVGKETDLSGVESLLASAKLEKLSNPNDGASTSYKFTINGVQKGTTIDIPKDMVVSSGEVRKLEDSEITEGREQGLYIVLTLANATSSKLYIPANALVDVYNGDSKYISVNQESRTINLNIADVTYSVVNSEAFTEKLNDLAALTQSQFDVEFPEVLVYGSTAWVQVNGVVSGFELKYGTSVIDLTRLNSTGRWSFTVPKLAKGSFFTASVSMPQGVIEKNFSPVIIEAPYVLNEDGHYRHAQASVSMIGEGKVRFEGTEFMCLEMERQENQLYLLFPESVSSLAVYNKGQYIPMEKCQATDIPTSARPAGFDSSWQAFKSPALKKDYDFHPKIVALFEDPTLS